MQPLYELGHTHHVEALRRAQAHRQAGERHDAAVPTICRRRLLGVLPIGPACAPRASAAAC
jgi:hypothetical protein